MQLAPGEIEADIRRFYPGCRLSQWWHTLRTGDVDGGMSPRELIVLVEELPDESRFKRRMGSGFTNVEALLAALVNNYVRSHVSEDEFDEFKHIIWPPNQQPVRPESDIDPVDNDDIQRMLAGDLSVYDEIEAELASMTTEGVGA